MNSTRSYIHIYQMPSDRWHNYSKSLSMATLPGSRTGMARLAQFFFFPLAKEESKPTTVFCFFPFWLTVQFWAVGVVGVGSTGYAVAHLRDLRLHFRHLWKHTVGLPLHTSTALTMCPVGGCLKGYSWSKQGAAKLFLQERPRQPGSPRVTRTKTHSQLAAPQSCSFPAACSSRWQHCQGLKLGCSESPSRRGGGDFDQL